MKIHCIRIKYDIIISEAKEIMQQNEAIKEMSARRNRHGGLR